MRKGQPLSVGIQMWTCPPPDYWSRHGTGQPRAEAITSHELGQQPPLSMRDSLAPCQLRSVGTALWKPDMFTAYPLIFIFLWPFTSLFSNLLWLFTLFVAVHPLLSSPKQKKKKKKTHKFPPLDSSLPSSDPGRSLLVKHSTEFRVKWLTQPYFVCLWWIDSRKTSVMRVI